MSELERKEPKPFNERLADGKAFEDFASDVLWANGIALGLYKSRAKQWRVGESRLGAEIKYDSEDNQEKYGNVFIEFEERRDESGEWRPCGIDDPLEPWLYVVGNWHRIFIFSVRTLRLAWKCGKYKTKDTGTSRGFVMPIPEAKEKCERFLEGSVLSTLYPWHKKP